MPANAPAGGHGLFSAVLDADLASESAADGIDEWLARTADPAGAQAPGLCGDGQSLHFHATDPGLSSTGQ